MLKCVHAYEYKDCPYRCNMWQYTRTWRRYYVDDSEIYSTDKHIYRWEICSSAPYGQIQGKHGYDLYHKGKFVKHGKTVKELKQFVDIKEAT